MDGCVSSIDFATRSLQLYYTLSLGRRELPASINNYELWLNTASLMSRE